MELVSHIMVTSNNRVYAMYSPLLCLNKELTKCFPIFIFQIFTANVLISGAGALHVPVTPNFKDKESFKGDAFHSCQWREGYNPTGKRVAVIGTGASAVQIVPAIASKVCSSEETVHFENTF